MYSSVFPNKGRERERGVLSLRVSSLPLPLAASKKSLPLSSQPVCVGGGGDIEKLDKSLVSNSYIILYNWLFTCVYVCVHVPFICIWVACG